MSMNAKSWNDFLSLTSLHEGLAARSLQVQLTIKKAA